MVTTGPVRLLYLRHSASATGMPLASKLPVGLSLSPSIHTFSSNRTISLEASPCEAKSQGRGNLKYFQRPVRERSIIHFVEIGLALEPGGTGAGSIAFISSFPIGRLLPSG